MAQTGAASYAPCTIKEVGARILEIYDVIT